MAGRVCVRRHETGAITLLWWDVPVSGELHKEVMREVHKDLSRLNGITAVLKILPDGGSIAGVGSKVTGSDFIIELDYFLYGTKSLEEKQNG